MKEQLLLFGPMAALVLPPHNENECCLAQSCSCMQMRIAVSTALSEGVDQCEVSRKKSYTIIHFVNAPVAIV